MLSVVDLVSPLCNSPLPFSLPKAGPKLQTPFFFHFKVGCLFSNRRRIVYMHQGHLENIYRINQSAISESDAKQG